MLNKFQLIGNLSKDPTMRFTPSGKAVTSFRVLVNTGFGDKKATEGFNITCWEKTAEAVNQYCKKGSKVYVEGFMKNRKYDKDGVETWVIDFVARDVRFLDSKKSGGNGATPEASEEMQLEGAAAAEDDFPF